MSDHHTYDDKELLRSIAEGKQAAFTVLFNRYRPKIYTVGLKLTRSEHQAEELVQEIFLKIWMKREALPMIDNFDAYLFTMTRHAAIRALRTTLRRNEVDVSATDNLVSLDTGLEHLLEVKEYQQLLKMPLISCPPNKVRSTGS